MSNRTTLTPVLQNVFRVLVQGAGKQNYPSLAALFDREEHTMHTTIRDLRRALEGTGVSISLHRRRGDTKSALVVSGDPKVIAFLANGAPTNGQSPNRFVREVTLPPIQGVPYSYTPEGRLTIGGELQPVRAA